MPFYVKKDKNKTFKIGNLNAVKFHFVLIIMSTVEEYVCTKLHIKHCLQKCSINNTLIYLLSHVLFVLSLWEVNIVRQSSSLD